MRSVIEKALERAACRTRSARPSCGDARPGRIRGFRSCRGGIIGRLAQAPGNSAEALGEDPDILLLDEPTNHLDLAGFKWLETLLQERGVCIRGGHHDRYFLEMS